MMLLVVGMNWLAIFLNFIKPTDVFTVFGRYDFGTQTYSQSLTFRMYLP